MGFWDTVQRAGLGVATGGISELAQDNPFGSDEIGDFINPGRDDREAALRDAKRAEAYFTSLEQGSMPSAEDLTLTQDEIDAGRLQNRWVYSADRALIDGPSGYRDASGLGMMDQGADYYQGVLAGDGFDAVADAQYQQAVQQAEQARRSQQEAVLRDAELRGMRGGGAEMLGAFSAAQGQATDQYNAGLAANAMRQQNRETAASAVAGIGAQRQSYDDAWQQWYQNAQTDVDSYNADRKYDADTKNVERGQYVDDANSAWARDVAGNRIGATQGAFDNLYRVRTGAANAAGGVATQNQANASERFDPFGVITDIGKGIAAKKIGGG